MKKQYLEICQIVTVHGLKGEVKANPWCDSPEMLSEFDKLYTDDTGKNTLEIVSSRVQKSQVIIKFSGFDTVEQAETLRNKILYADRNDFLLPENSYFIQDLIGLEVVDIDTGKNYGVITDVLQTGANDVYVVKGEKEVLVPSIADVVIETNIDGNFIKIRPLNGLFDI
ncbi:MAG: ribosome maturation factor RimM [Oscillospiraceae bacterium]|jgi:16S rRNA processing protein RimM|nr:ribosome maturation factor RimM [Oscillospiraceae bacterium]